MRAIHSIEVDVEAGVVRYSLAGFFDKASLASLQTERAAKLPQLKTARNQHVTLCDVSKCSIQSPEAVASLRAMLLEPRWRSRRLAFVVGGALARMQVRRITDDMPNVSWFDDIASAEAWLMTVN